MLGIAAAWLVAGASPLLLIFLPRSLAVRIFRTDHAWQAAPWLFCFTFPVGVVLALLSILIHLLF